jgi:exopolysaccharide production protein ExoZ
MNPNFLGLQILRFAAAMLVVVMHSTQAISIRMTGTGADHYWDKGSAGVDIFFVISGFVMACSIGKQAPSWGGVAPAWMFFKRRIVRILPMYWFYTVLKEAAVLALPSLAVASSARLPGYFFASLFFIPVLNQGGLAQPFLPVGWTLNFEMLFYLIFALAIGLRLNRIAVCTAAFAALFLAHRFFPGSVALAFYAQTIIFEFLIGVALAGLILRATPPSAGLSLLLMLSGWLYLLLPVFDASADRFLTWGLAAGAIVLGTVWLEGTIRRLPLVSPLAFLGDASYSLYLSHTFVVPLTVLFLAALGMHTPALALPVVLCAAVAGSALSYRWIEKPLTRLFKRWMFQSPAASLPAPTATADASAPTIAPR